MRESFYSCIDDLGMAIIDLNEFGQWLQRNGIELGIQLKADDAEERLKQKLEVEPGAYMLKQDDYYRGVQTILNSEVAAMAKVKQILREMKDENKELFFDNDFGPQSEDDDENHRNSLYFNGQAPPGYPKPE